MKKPITLIFIIIFSLFLIIILYFLIENSYNKKVYIETKYSNNDKSNNLSLSLPANISVKSGNRLEVKYYSTEKPHLSISDNKKDIYVEKTEKTESFFSKISKTITIGDNHLDRAEVTIPDNIKNINVNSNEFRNVNSLNLLSISITNKNGDTEITNSNLGNLMISNINGDTHINNSKLGKLFVNNKNGDVSLNNTDIAEKDSKICNKNGDTNITNSNSKFKNTFVNTSNGDIYLQNTKNIIKSEK